MANEKMPGIPSVPGDETTWTAFVDQFETLKAGDSSVSLTEWATGNTTIPAIAAGCAIEIAGGTYRFTAQTVIDTAGASDGTVYVIIETSGDNALPGLTNTAPTWRDDLNGWYNAAGDGRYTGHVMEKAGASYSEKRIWFGENDSYVSVKPGNNQIQGMLNAANFFPTSNLVRISIGLPTVNSPYTITQKGIIYIYNDPPTGSRSQVVVEANISGSWRTILSTFDQPQSSFESAQAVTVFSTGTGLRVYGPGSELFLTYYEEQG